MEDRDLEPLFERFRSGGDLDALAEVFDRTAPRLLQVARHLASDEARAEDLVQETFVAAIEGARRFDARRELVPWLTGILANRAKRASERWARRPDPARLAEPGVDDPVERAAVDEFAAALERALARVPEAYRDVLHRHLAHGLEPRAIAPALEREPGLVRVQLHRGFAHLRRLLPAGFALGGAVVVAPSRGLAEVRRVVAEEAARRGAEVATAVSTGAVLGGVVMTKKLVAGVVAIAAAALLWIGWRGGDEPEGPSERSAATVEELEPVETVAVEVEDTEVEPPAEAERVAIGESVDTAAEDPYGSLALRLVWWDGTPAAKTRMRVMPYGEHGWSRVYFHATTDEAGEVTFERLHEGKVGFRCDRTRIPRSIQIVRGVRNEAIVEIPRGVDVIGRVIDANEDPVSGATIWSDGGEFLSWSHPVGTAASDGTFLVRSLDRSSMFYATDPREGASAWTACRDLTVNADTIGPVELRLRGGDVAAQGRVFDPEGRPVAGAVVAIRCQNTVSVRDDGRWPFSAALTDDEGSWRLEGLHPGRAVLYASAPRFALYRSDLTLVEGTDCRADVTLDRGFTVRGTATLADGSPAVKAGISVTGPGLESDLHYVATLTDEAGGYVLENVAAGDAVLRATLSSQGATSSTKLTGRVGEELVWNVEFGGGLKITGYAVDEETGERLVGWQVLASCPSNPLMEMTTTTEAGRFELAGLLDEPYGVSLTAPGSTEARGYVQGVRPGPEELVLEARPEASPRAFVTGRVLDPDGAPIRPRKITARSRDHRSSVSDVTWSADEHFELGPLEAKPYDVSLTFDGDQPGLNYEVALSDGEVHDLGDIHLQRPGRVELLLRGPDGEPLAEYSTTCLRRPGARYVAVLGSEDGLTYESGEIDPGIYRLEVTAANLALDRPWEIEVFPGETTTKTVPLVHGHRLSFFLHVPEGEELPSEFRLQLRDHAGALLVDERREPSTQQSPSTHESITFLSYVTSLPVGTYTYSGSGDGWTARGICAVTAGMEQWPKVDVELVREE